MNRQTLAIVIGCLLSTMVVAQDEGPLEHGRFVLVGYGDVTYMDGEMAIMDDNGHFNSRFVPIFLYQLNDRLHIEAEVEYGFSGDGETETTVEYAGIHYFLTDTTTITAGKLLLPFAQFGPNLHPSWINRLPSMPGIYGGHHGEAFMDAMLPIMTDIGVSVQQTFKFGDNQKLMFNAFVSNGVGASIQHVDAGGDDHGEAEEGHEEAEEGHEEAEEVHEETEEEGAHGAPEIMFNAVSVDNNDDKAFGGRIAYGFFPQFEIGYSYYRAAYDDDEQLDFTATAVDLTWLSAYFSLRAEYIKTDIEGFVEDHETELLQIETFDRSGWYAQGTWQLRQFKSGFLNPIELVARYSRINNEGDQWTYGINYWLSPSTAFKLAFDETELADGSDESRVFVQISYGF